MEERPYAETLGLLIEANAAFMIDHLKAGSRAKAHQHLAKLIVTAATRIEWWIFGTTHFFAASFEILW